MRQNNLVIFSGQLLALVSLSTLMTGTVSASKDSAKDGGPDSAKPVKKLEAPWTPPAPERSEQARKRKRKALATVAYGAPNKAIDDLPGDEDFLWWDHPVRRKPASSPPP